MFSLTSYLTSLETQLFHLLQFYLGLSYINTFYMSTQLFIVWNTVIITLSICQSAKSITVSDWLILLHCMGWIFLLFWMPAHSSHHFGETSVSTLPTDESWGFLGCLVEIHTVPSPVWAPGTVASSPRSDSFPALGGFLPYMHWSVLDWIFKGNLWIISKPLSLGDGIRNGLCILLGFRNIFLNFL